MCENFLAKMFDKIYFIFIKYMEYLFMNRRTNVASKSLRHKGPVFWYKIPNEIKLSYTLNTFKHQLKKCLLSGY